MEVDLDQARRRAKELLRAACAGDPRARAVLRPDRPPRLADAQHAVARQLGFTSWPGLVAHVETVRLDRDERRRRLLQAALGGSADGADRLAAGDPSAGSDAARVASGSDETVLEPGPDYAPGHPVRIHVRIRGRRLDLDDTGAAVRRAGTPDGWLEVAERVVARAGLNVNRRGVVFLPAVTGRDPEALARLVAETSRALHHELLELDG